MKRLFFTLALAFIAIPAWGQSPAWSRTNAEILCANNLPDVRIKMCTSLILFGGEGALRLAAIYLNRGIAYWQKGLYDKAFADATKAIELNPNFASAYTMRGEAYSRKGSYDQAIADFTKAIELRPDFLPYSGRGVAYDGKGLYDQAIADFTKAIELRPDFVSYAGRGVAYNRKSLSDQAIADFTKAIALRASTIKPSRMKPRLSSSNRVMGLLTIIVPGPITRRAKTPKLCQTLRGP